MIFRKVFIIQLIKLSLAEPANQKPGQKQKQLIRSRDRSRNSQSEAGTEAETANQKPRQKQPIRSHDRSRNSQSEAGTEAIKRTLTGRNRKYPKERKSKVSTVDIEIKRKRIKGIQNKIVQLCIFIFVQPCWA